MDLEITWNFDQHPEPPVQGVGGEVVFRGAHDIIAPRVLEQQAVPML
jgi:hypothetical protein